MLPNWDIRDQQSKKQLAPGLLSTYIAPSLLALIIPETEASVRPVCRYWSIVACWDVRCLCKLAEAFSTTSPDKPCSISPQCLMALIGCEKGKQIIGHSNHTVPTSEEYGATIS